MKPIKNRYKELISLIQLFLFQKHHLKITDSNEHVNFQKKISIPVTGEQKKRTPSPITDAAAKVPEINDNKPLPTPNKQCTTVEPEDLPNFNDNLSKKEKEGKPISKSSMLKLEPLNAPIISNNFPNFQKLLNTLVPDWILGESTPSDALAKKIKNTWTNDSESASILILSFQEQEKHLAFLKNIAHAISLHLAPARILFASNLEKENLWETILKRSQLRLVIANDYELYLQPRLMNHYREHPQQGKHYLNDIPLLLLSDPSLYLKEPQLKPLLWRAICNEFTC